MQDNMQCLYQKAEIWNAGDPRLYEQTLFVQAGGAIANTDKKKRIIRGTMEETLENINFTYVRHHDHLSLVLFRTVVEIINYI